MSDENNSVLRQFPYTHGEPCSDEVRDVVVGLISPVDASTLRDFARWQPFPHSRTSLEHTFQEDATITNLPLPHLGWCFESKTPVVWATENLGIDTTTGYQNDPHSPVVEEPSCPCSLPSRKP